MCSIPVGWGRGNGLCPQVVPLYKISLIRYCLSRVFVELISLVASVCQYHRATHLTSVTLRREKGQRGLYYYWTPQNNAMSYHRHLCYLWRYITHVVHPLIVLSLIIWPWSCGLHSNTGAQYYHGPDPLNRPGSGLSFAPFSFDFFCSVNGWMITR